MRADVIEQSAQVIWDVLGLDIGYMPRDSTIAARALADAGLLRKELPSREEIARAIRQATDDGASRTEDYADAVLALLEGERR